MITIDQQPRHAPSAEKTACRQAADTRSCCATAPPAKTAGDGRLRDQALRTIAHHPHFRGRVRTIDVECHQGNLVLTGRLPSYYLKLLLQSSLMNMKGVEAIDNRVIVVNSEGVSLVGDQKDRRPPR